MSKWFTISTIALLPLAFALGQAAATRKPTVYENPQYGFRLEAPNFAGTYSGPGQVAVIMYGPQSENFPPNINVMVQPKQDPTAFRQITLAQFEQQKWKLEEDKKLKVQGHDALLFDYSGSLNGVSLHWLALAVFDRERTLLVTCTATSKQFEQLKSAFRASVDSFALLTP